MNILHINQSDLGGGAAIAAYRLHQGLLANEVDSRLLVGEAKTQSQRVKALDRWSRWENQLSRINRKLGLNYINLISSFAIPNEPIFQAAEIINFHNLHTGYFNYLAIPRLTQHKPGVLSLHDMWSLTGHCVHSYECDRWKTGCGRCPYPKEYPSIERDGTRWEWKLKQWVYAHSNLTVVANSRWTEAIAQQSLLKRFDIHYIPLGLDVNVYQPLDQQQCQQLLGLPQDKIVLMFGVFNPHDRWKGADLLIKILENLPPRWKEKVLLLTFGHQGESITEKVNLPTVSLGYVSHERLKAIAYSASDLFLLPSRAESFGLVALEAAACGKPTVAFNVGGVSDIVRPGVTGELVPPEDTSAFVSAIAKLLDDPEKYNRLSHNCREVAEKEFSIELQTERYIKLYQSILENAHSQPSINP